MFLLMRGWLFLELKVFTTFEFMMSEALDDGWFDACNCARLLANARLACCEGLLADRTVASFVTCVFLGRLSRPACAFLPGYALAFLLPLSRGGLLFTLDPVGVDTVNRITLKWCNLCL